MKKSNKRTKKKRKLLLGVLCLVFASVFIFSAYKVYTIIHGYNEAEKRYDLLMQSVLAADAATSAQGDDTAPAAETDPGSTEKDSSPVTVDFDELAKISDYVVGWLYLPDTVINYPVAQYRDNEYFLDRFIDGKVQVGGTLFVDCSCPGDFSGQNSVIYGHNMRDGSMFACLDDFGEQEFYNAHPVIYLSTPTCDYRIEVFSAFTTSAVSYVYTTFFPYASSFDDHISALRYMSEIKSEVEVGPDDRIVTLSTCAYSFDDARFVVIGKLVPME